MTRRRVAVVIGTRPEAIKLGPVVRELDARADAFETLIITTSQHREMLDQALDLLALHPHVDLNLMQEDQALGEYASRALEQLTREIEKLQPDMVIVQGDTTTAAMAALAAFYLDIPVGHVEAGLRSFDRRNPFPEEANRRLAAVLADVHFAPTPRARQNLLAEGCAEETIFVTGNTIVDALADIELGGGWDDPAVGDVDFAGAQVLLATAHRRENLEAGIGHICDALGALARRDNVDVLYPVHLNPRVQEVARSTLAGAVNVHLTAPLSYRDLLRSLDRCTLVLTDSGGIQEEAPSFQKPVLVLRDVTERPELIESGAGILVGTDSERIVREATRLLDDPAAYQRMASVENPFGDGKAASRIAEILTEVLGA